MLISPVVGLIPGRLSHGFRSLSAVVPNDSDMSSCRPESQQDGDDRGRRIDALLNRQLNARSASPRLFKTLPSPESNALLYAHHRSMSHSAADGYAPPPEVLRAALSSTPSKRRVVRVPFPPGYRASREDTSHRALAYDSTTDCDQDDVNDDCNKLDIDYLYTAGDAVEHMGVGRMQYILLFAMSIHAVMQGMDITFLTVLPTLADCDYHLSEVEKAMTSSIFFIGVVIGAFSFGFLGDTKGRNRALLLATAWTVYLSFLTILAYSYAWLLVFRFLVGIGIGGFSLRNALMFEFLPTSFRVKSAFIILISWALGTVLEIPILLIPGIKWQYIMAINHVGHFAVISCLLYLPESPRYLLKQSLHRDAKQCLLRIAKLNGTCLPAGELVTEDEKAAILEADHPFPNQKPRIKYKDSLLGLYQTRTLRATTVILNIIWFSLFFAEYGMYFFSAELLKNLHGHVTAADPPAPLNITAAFLSNMSLSDANLVAEEVFCLPASNTSMFAPSSLPSTSFIEATTWTIANSSAAIGNFTNATLSLPQDSIYHCVPLTSKDYLSLFATFSGAFPGILFFFWVMDIVGRRTAIAINCAAACVLIGCLMIPHLTRLPLTILLAALRAVLTAAFKILLVYTPEVYPTPIRSRGTGFHVAVGRVGAVVTPFVAQVLLSQSLVGGEFVYLAFCALSGILALLLPIETKGRPLPD